MLCPNRRGLKLDVADEETDNKYREPYFNFYDARLMGVEWANQPNVELTTEFFRLLALCHTVIPDGERHSQLLVLRTARCIWNCTGCAVQGQCHW